MQLDYIDLFYSHRYDPQTPIEETLQTLVDVVKSGKALYVGLSRWPLEQTRVALEYLAEAHTPCLIYQGRYNLLDRKPQEEGILNLLREKNVGFISFSPLAQGLLSNRYLHGISPTSRMHLNQSLRVSDLTPKLRNKLEQLNHVAASRNETLSQMALSWILNTPGITSVLVGVSSKEQLIENISIPKLSFDNQELQHIDHIVFG